MMDKYMVMCLVAIAVIGLISAILYWAATFAKLSYNIEMKELETFELSFADVNEVIDTVIQEIYNNKYLLNYRLRDIRILANMDEEVYNITMDVMDAFDQRFLERVYKFYTKEYLVQMVTRRVSILIVDYTNTYKPTTR